MKSEQAILAERFSKALTKSEFDEAHALLTRAAKLALSVAELRRRYKEMTDYGGPVIRVEAMQDTTIWPGKERDDVAWVYVAISGDSFAEAVSDRRRCPRRRAGVDSFGRMVRTLEGLVRLSQTFRTLSSQHLQRC